MRDLVPSRLAGWTGCGLLLGMFCCVGCGEPVGQVTGLVTWKKQPVVGAELVFQSSSKPEETFSGNSGEGGKYQISYRTHKGLPVGAYKITITRYTAPGGKDLPAGEQGDVLKSQGKAVRQAFAFEKTITAGANAIDFELSEGKKVQLPQE
jgi:hypothetical protein